MNTWFPAYYDLVCNTVRSTLTRDLTVDRIPEIVEAVFVPRTTIDIHIRFHRYYLTITGHPEVLLNQQDAMIEFRNRYSLQRGVPDVSIRHIEDQKAELIHLLQERPADAYWRFFHQLEIRFRDDRTIVKNLMSFFTKVLHTIRPGEFSALDNPIKKYFGLRDQGFIMAYSAINDAYLQWITENQPFLRELRQAITQMDNGKILQVDRLSDLKLIDMIYWWQENRGNA